MLFNMLVISFKIEKICKLKNFDVLKNVMLNFLSKWYKVGKVSIMKEL